MHGIHQIEGGDSLVGVKLAGRVTAEVLVLPARPKLAVLVSRTLAASPF